MVLYSLIPHGGKRTINQYQRIVQFNILPRLRTQTITNTGNTATIQFFNNSTAGNAIITNNAGATLQVRDSATLGNATLINNGTLDATSVAVSTWGAGSISGSGTVELGSTRLVLGQQQSEHNFHRNDGGAGGSLTKVGNGTLNVVRIQQLYRRNSANGGTLNLLSSLSSDVTVGVAGNLSEQGALGILSTVETVTPGASGSAPSPRPAFRPGRLKYWLQRDVPWVMKITGNANLTAERSNITAINIAVGRYSVLNAGSLTGTSHFEAARPSELCACLQPLPMRSS